MARIKIETYDYGVKYATRYKDMAHFENNVYVNEGYVLTEDEMIINAKEIKCACMFENNRELEKRWNSIERR